VGCALYLSGFAHVTKGEEIDHAVRLARVGLGHKRGLGAETERRVAVDVVVPRVCIMNYVSAPVRCVRLCVCAVCACAALLRHVGTRVEVGEDRAVEEAGVAPALRAGRGAAHVLLPVGRRGGAHALIVVTYDRVTRQQSS
jgi:hypothetical protein